MGSPRASGRPHGQGCTFLLGRRARTGSGYARAASLGAAGRLGANYGRCGGKVVRSRVCSRPRLPYIVSGSGTQAWRNMPRQAHMKG